jgi:hypothetical protein
MKKNLLIAFVFIILLYPLSNGSSEEKKYYVLDGYEWAKMSGLEKLGFVKGWLQADGAIFHAMSGLYLDPFRPERMKNPDKFTDCLVSKCWDIVLKAMQAEGLGLEDFTLGQILGTISKIYSDPRVKKWEITKIMPIVYGRLSKGWTEREVDEVIAFYIKFSNFNERFKDILSRGTFKNETERDKYFEEYFSLMEKKPEGLKALEEYQ